MLTLTPKKQKNDSMSKWNEIFLSVGYIASDRQKIYLRNKSFTKNCPDGVSSGMNTYHSFGEFSLSVEFLLGF
jgi:hypothetical protein